MKYSIELRSPSSPEWLKAVLADFPSFLQDHADCERKASAMALSFVAKYPDRSEIIPELIDTALEELDHFRQVYSVMEQRSIRLSHQIPQDLYAKTLVDLCHSGREERFLDRLLLASVLECRGTERFRLISEAIQDASLARFYKMLWTSEARHGNMFVRMALRYFSEENVYQRLEWLMEQEALILAKLPVRPALH
ncbi:MAG: tRNA-(ms[2]io[6]A)-hydroxylase [Bacteroidia bacterium]